MNKTAMIHSFCRLSVFLIVMFINTQAVAEDSLSDLMQRMRSDSAVKIAYQETRRLELFDQAWHGSGYMYSSPTGLMLREQLTPRRLLMAVNDKNMFYFDPGIQIRHQAKIEQGDPVSLQIAVFQALINADENLLKSLYQVEFETTSQRWLMKLKSKQADNDMNIVVSGPLLQKVDTIIIQQADGDQSEFMLQSEQGISGQKITDNVNRLYAELVGE